MATISCKEKPKKTKGKISLATIKKRLKWAKPGCRMFHKKMVTICADFFKRKKRKTPELKPFAISCAKMAVKNPRTMYQRFACAERAPTCGHFRHCNHCGRFFCPKWKKGPKVAKIKLPTLRKKPLAPGSKKAPTTDRRKAPPAGAPRKAPAARPTDRRAAPTKRAPAPARPAARTKAPARPKPRGR